MDGSRIKDITAQGLTYLNEQDEEVFINFAACFQRWLDQHTGAQGIKSIKEPNHMNDAEWDEFVEDIKVDKKVAYRNFDGDAGLTHPYIEFFTEPAIRFEFPGQKGFYEVLGKLKQAGWRTFDMT